MRLTSGARAGACGKYQGGVPVASGSRFGGRGQSQSTEGILGSGTTLYDSVMVAAKSLLEQSNRKKCKAFLRLCVRIYYAR